MRIVGTRQQKGATLVRQLLPKGVTAAEYLRQRLCVEAASRALAAHAAALEYEAASPLWTDEGGQPFTQEEMRQLLDEHLRAIDTREVILQAEV